MCHPDVPRGQQTPASDHREVIVELPGGERMPALQVSSTKPAPAVLLIGDVFGRTPFYEHLAALLAQSGFQVLLPDFFFRQGPLPDQSKEAAFARRGRLDETKSVDDLGAAIGWLRSRSQQRAVATIGFCMGATFALNLASTERDLATVAYYGFPEPKSAMPPPRPIDLVADLRGPILAFWGDHDETVGIDSVERYVSAALDAGADLTAEVISGLGHGFLGSADLEDPADPAAGTWLRTLDFLRTHLNGEETR